MSEQASSRRGERRGRLLEERRIIQNLGRGKKNGGGSTEFDRRILGEEEEEDRRLGS